MTYKTTTFSNTERKKGKQWIQVPFCTITIVKELSLINVLNINSKLRLTASCRSIKCNINLSVSKAMIHRLDTSKDQKTQELGNLRSKSNCELVNEYRVCSKFISPFCKITLKVSNNKIAWEWLQTVSLSSKSKRLHQRQTMEVKVNFKMGTLLGRVFKEYVPSNITQTHRQWWRI